MAEEFQESDVMFHDNCDIDYDDVDSAFTSKWKNKKQKTNNAINSVPMSIPYHAKNRDTWLRFDDSDSGEDDRKFVPPHLITRQRVAGKMMAYSVCTGNGRTLKGRDLSEVRNLVLRLTGFLET